MNRIAVIVAAFSVVSGVTPPASSATITGRVVDANGRPAANTFVSARNAARKISTTVLTDRTGGYRIDDLYPGTYELRARRAGVSDGTQAGVLLSELDATANLNLGAADPALTSTPGAAWLQALPNDPIKATFISSCTICHDMGSVVARQPRDKAAWLDVIKMMRNQTDIYSVILKMDDTALAEWLERHQFGKQPTAWDAFRPSANVVSNARVVEYEVGDVNSWAHDMAVEPATGAAWVGDYINDVLIRVDARTGAQTVVPIPLKTAGMHTLNFDRDGALWVTFQFADMVGRYETAKGTWRLYAGFERSTFVHSFALDTLGFVAKDAKGRIWMSQFGGNKVSALDPVSGKLDEFVVEGAKGGRLYGIALNSTGKVWYTKYSENKLGYFDPATRKRFERDGPRPDGGPHRIHIDDEDNLWIPLSGYGTIWQYNTKTGVNREIRLPDADTFPYVNLYDAKSKRLWIAGNGANSIYAYDPKTGKFTTFRLPSIESYPRMISIDYTTGDLWTALSSFPNKHALRDHGLLLKIPNALEQVR
jgi:virginiamycin B lyase